MIDCPGRRIGVQHAKLHPDRLGLDCDGFIHDTGGIVTIAEDIDHIDRFGNVGKGGDHRLTVNFPACLTGIDRDPFGSWPDPVVVIFDSS